MLSILAEDTDEKRRHETPELAIARQVSWRGSGYRCATELMYPHRSEAAV